MERKDELEAQVRKTSLRERLDECRTRIGKMCSEGRPPRMCIPVQWDDDDFYISTTLADAQRALDAEREKVKVLEAELEEYRSIAEQQGASRAVSQLATLQAQLPTEMPGCTILFKECENGHGRLTATNWIDHGCGTCTLEQLQAQLAAWQTGRMNICLLCGRDKPCMTDEAAIAAGGPGSPCTFDPTPRELFAENKRLKAQLRQVEGQSQQQAEEAVIVFAKDTTLRQLLEDVLHTFGYLRFHRVAGMDGLLYETHNKMSPERTVEACEKRIRATLAAKDAGKAVSSG